MKKLLFVFFLLPLFSLAQDCFLKKDSDPITNEPKMVSGFVPFNGSGIQLAISTETSAKEVNLYFLLENPNPCFNEYSTAIVLLEDNRTKIRLKNIGGTNCQGIFQVMYRNSAITPAFLERLSSKKISSIQFKPDADSDKIISVSLNATQQQQLLTMLLCIIKEAKTMFK